MLVNIEKQKDCTMSTVAAKSPLKVKLGNFKYITSYEDIYLGDREILDVVFEKDATYGEYAVFTFSDDSIESHWIDEDIVLDVYVKKEQPQPQPQPQSDQIIVKKSDLTPEFIQSICFNFSTTQLLDLQQLINQVIREKIENSKTVNKQKNNTTATATATATATKTEKPPKTYEHYWSMLKKWGDSGKSAAEIYADPSLNTDGYGQATISEDLKFYKIITGKDKRFVDIYDQSWRNYILGLWQQKPEASTWTILNSLFCRSTGRDAVEKNPYQVGNVILGELSIKDFIGE